MEAACPDTWAMDDPVANANAHVFIMPSICIEE
jgi:hypothetical protein